MTRYLFPALLLALACRPKPAPPPPADTTAVVVDTTTPPDTLCDGCRISPDSDTLVATSALRRAAPTSGGIPAGLSGWPTSNWCTGPINEVVTTVSPTAIGGYLRAAAKCGVKVWVTYPRAYERTSWGGSSGRFSPSNAKRLTDWYLQQFPADSMRKYYQRGTFLGFVVMDDMRCTACWGGVLVPPADVAQLTIYAKSRLPVPITIRITPDWIAAYGGWQKSVDAAWAQYTKNKRDPVAWFGTQMRGAKALGINLVAAVSVYSCQTVATMDPCTATEVKTFFHAAFTQPICAANGWRYDSHVNSRTDIKAAYQSVADDAKTKTPRSCMRAP